jgi:hypothetical protein
VQWPPTKDAKAASAQSTTMRIFETLCSVIKLGGKELTRLDDVSFGIS